MAKSWFLIFSLLVLKATTMKIEKTKIQKCYKGYYLSQNSTKCLRIPGPLCNKPPKVNHFRFGRCDQGKIRTCPIKRCRGKGTLFADLCICISRFVQQLILKNFNYKKHKKRFIEQFNTSQGINSRIGQCVVGYRIEGEKCEKTLSNVKCGKICRKGYEIISSKCVCAKTPKCKIKSCKVGNYLRNCQCKQNKTKTRVILKRLGLICPRKNFRLKIKLNRKKIRSKIRKIRNKIMKKRKMARLRRSRRRRMIRKSKRQIMNSRNRMIKKHKTHVRKVKNTIQKNKNKVHKMFKNHFLFLKNNQSENKQNSVPNAIEVEKASFINSIFNVKKKKNNIENYQKTLNNLLNFDFNLPQKIQKKKGKIKKVKPIKKYRKNYFFENLSYFKSLVNEKEIMSNYQPNKPKQTIKKCKFGFYLDHSKDKCRNLSPKYNKNCSQKCLGKYYLVPGLCTCMIRPKCPIRKCIRNYYLTKNCICIVSPLKMIDINDKIKSSFLQSIFK